MKRLQYQRFVWEICTILMSFLENKGVSLKRKNEKKYTKSTCEQVLYNC